MTETMTARALLEAVADEIRHTCSECYAIGSQIPRTLARLWSDRIRAIASSLAEQPAHSRAQDSGGEAVVLHAGWYTFVHDCAACAGGEVDGNVLSRKAKALLESLPSAEQPAKGEGVPATMFHDAGAIARCSYCGRYSMNPRTLSDWQPVCDCGERHGWSGSFDPPHSFSVWTKDSTPQPSDPADAEIVDRLRLVESTLRNTEHHGLGKACGRMADGLAARTLAHAQRQEGEPRLLLEDLKLSLASNVEAINDYLDTHPQAPSVDAAAVLAHEWRWVDEKGRAMTEWKQGDPPPILDVSDSKGTMSVEVRLQGAKQ